MPTQDNFKSNIAELSQNYTKYTVSRVVETNQNNLLETELPAEFSDNDSNSIEISVYSINNNLLVFSGTISNSIVGAIKVETVRYEDSSIRKLLFIDFSKLVDFDVPIGQYSVTLSFFSNEIGSFDERSLKFIKISPSRLEVELQGNNVDTLKKFALPSINTTWVMDAVAQIFNQPQSISSQIPTIKTTTTPSVIENKFTAEVTSSIKQYGFDDGDDNIYSIAQEILDAAYTLARVTIMDRMKTDDSRFTDEELKKIIRDSLTQAYNTYVTINQVKVSKLPYALSVGD